MIDAGLNEFHDWIYRYRPATAEPFRLLLLLHGWTGDENSMWIFARKLPAQVAVVAPRGLFAASEGGYTWRETRSEIVGLPSILDLTPAVEKLINFIDDWSGEAGMSINQFDVVGFSQGAALSYALALLHPERIRAIAALSGFIPNGAENLHVKRPLEGKHVYVAHGRQDYMIPVERAREDVIVLRRFGALVTYCESDGGHKVSIECLGEMVQLFG